MIKIINNHVKIINTTNIFFALFLLVSGFDEKQA